MAAPQQDTLSNVPCTLAASSTVLAAAAATYRSSTVASASTSASSADSYGSGHQPASCGDVYGRLSRVSVPNIGTAGVPCGGSSAAHYPSPRPASRRVRPCSLCGTAALRSNTTTALLPPDPLEQPVVLLHRLEDGLPQGDVNSLRAYGTIRLLPVHSPSENSNNALEGYSSEHDGDSDPGEVNHAMAQSVEVGEGGKDEDRSTGSTDYTTWVYSNGEDHSHLLSETNGDRSVSDRSVCSKVVRTEVNSEVIDSVNVIEKKGEESDGHFLGVRIQSVVLGKDLNTKFHLEEGDVGVSDHSLASWGRTCAFPQPNTPSTSASSVAYSSNLPCQPSCSTSCPTHQPLTGAVPPPLFAPSAVLLPSCPTINPVPSTTQILSSHSTLSTSYTNPSVTYTTLSTRRYSPPVRQPSPTTTQPSPAVTEPSPTATDHSISATTCPQPSTPSSPYTSMSTVLSSTVLSFPSSSPAGLLLSSLPESYPSASSTSPPTFSHPNSPPSPSSSPMSSPSPTHPSSSGHEPSHFASSVDSQILPPSSPYSPRTLTSSPASPASLPSRAESPPSPALSCESPTQSPDLFSGLLCDEARHLSTHLLNELPENDTGGTSAVAMQVGVLPNSQDEQSDTRLGEGCQDELSLESEVRPLPESESDLTKDTANSDSSADADNIKSPMDAQVNLSTLSQVNPSGAIQVEAPKETQTTEAVLDEVDAQVEPSEGTKAVPFVDSKENKVDSENLAGESAEGSAEYCERVRDQKESNKGPMRLKFRLRHKLDIPPPPEAEKLKCNKDNGIPKIVLTLKGNGPNKEYSCSNRLRSEARSLSSVNLNNKKHKSKKDKRQRLRCKEKIKKGLKGNKHKRHLELFGENSNDSYDIISEKCNGAAGGKEQLNKAKVEGQKVLPLPVAFPTLGESPEHSDDVSSAPAEKVSSAPNVKGERVCEKIKYSSASDSLDDSLSDSLPDLEPLPPPSEDCNPKSEDIRSPMAEEAVQESEGKVESAMTEDILQDGSPPPPVSAEDLSVADSTWSEKASQKDTATIPATHVTISNVFPLPRPERLTNQREPDPSENPRGCTLRTRRDRLVKNSESDRDSDTCLWVSFGVDGPVPLPASDVPSLEPILSSGAETCKGSESDRDTDSSQSVDYKSSEETNQVSTVRKQDVGEKNSETKNLVDSLVEERAEVLVKEYNERQKRLSSGCSKLPSFDNEAKDWPPLKKNAKVKREYRRSSSYKARESGEKVRQSFKRVSRFSASLQARQGKEVHEANFAKDISSEDLIKQGNTSQEFSANTSSGGASNDQKTDSLAPDHSDPSEADRLEMQNCVVFKPPVSQATSVIVSGSSDKRDSLLIAEEQQAISSAGPLETIEPADRLVQDLDTDEQENQYYRPKKIRRVSDLKLSTDPTSETESSGDPQDCRRSWSVVSEAENNKLYDRNLSIDENQDCPETVVTPEAITPVPLEDLATEPSGEGSCSSKVESETGEVEMDTSEKMLPEDSSPRDTLMESSASASQDPESKKEQRRRKSRPQALWRKDSKVGSQEDLSDGTSMLTTDGTKTESSDKQDSLLLKEDSLSAKEEPQQDTSNKEEKEKKRRSRKDRRKDGPGSVSKTSALQEAQLRREVLHEEERGRRLAQEIKGFNWLEQKIKNGSLLSSCSSPPTPPSKEPSALVSRSSPPASAVSSNPPSTPTSNTQFPFAPKKEEGDCKKSWPSGSSGGTGLRGHLQTAVPPLVPSWRVTALPKRRLSPTQLPALTHSTTAALYNSTNVSSMTVQGTINSTVPTLHGTSHGKTGTNCGKPCVAAACDTTDSNKATLYSSTTCNKATLYGVNSDSLEVLYDSVTTSSANYYVRADNANASVYDGTTTTAPSIFCGSAKNLESIPHSVVQSSAGVTTHPSVLTSTTIAPTVPGDCAQQVKGHIRPPDFSHPNSTPPVSSADLAVVEHSCSSSINSQRASTTVPPTPQQPASTTVSPTPQQSASTTVPPTPQQSASTTVPTTPQQFSHKHTLLRRAFREMLKSDSESSPEPAEQGKSVFQFDNAAELPTREGVSKLEEASPAFTPLLTTSASRSPASVAEESPLSSQATTEDVEMSEHVTSHVDLKIPLSKIESEEPPGTVRQEELPGTVRQEDLPGTVRQEELSGTVRQDEPPGTVRQEELPGTVRQDESPGTVRQEEPPGTLKQEEIQADDDKNTELQNIKTKEMQKIHETVQNRILESITDAGGEIDVKSLRSEIKSDKGKEEDKEMQSSLLLSVLYKELMKTRQEVEKLRKIQELMLTEKGDKKEDDTEESNREDIIFNEEKCEKRKFAKEFDCHEPHLDSKELSHPEAKKSKISIRNDLLPADTSITLATPPVTSDISCLRNSSPQARSSPSVLKTNPQISTIAKVPLASPALSESSSELSVISLVSSAVSQTSHVSSRTSPGISRTSPGVSGMSRTSPGLSRTSPGLPMTSPGLPRTSPGLPRTCPGLPRTSPGLPRASPGLPRTSPGLPRSSPGLPRTSPGLLRTSPGLPRTSPGLPRMSPGVPRTSPAAPQSDVIVPRTSPAVSQNTQFVPQTCPAVLTSPTSLPTANTVMTRVTIAQSDSSPGAVRPRYVPSSYGSTPIPQISPISRVGPVIPRTSPVISRVSHAMSRSSPVIPRTSSASSSVPISKPDAQLTGMSPNKLRTVFGISNSEVEVMPVSVGGKFPLSEPQPQTYLKLVEDHHHQAQEASILLNAVKGLRRNSSSKDIEIIPSHGPSPFRCPQTSHEDTRRTHHPQFYEGEIKRNAFSTSELPDFPPSVRKLPPPLKPAASLVRRHSDSLDVRQVDPMMHRLMYPSTHTNPAISAHSTSSSSTEQQNTSLYSFPHLQCSPTQYASNAQTLRRNSDSNCPERSREYQQAVAMSMKQHPYPQHLSSSAPMMRSLGPDKATIFPIPAPMSTVIRPFKPPTPPTSTRTMLEQYQSENFYQSNFSFFERLRENIQQGCETGNGAERGGHAAQERLQPPTGTVEKPLQPQTFAPRVLVRESIPETPRMPPPTFSAPNFANTNQHMSTVLPSHHGRFPNNMHPSNTIHHITSTGLHPGSHQGASSVMANNNNAHHSNSGGSGPGEKRQCLNCPQSARFVCSGCKKAWYCSEQCQRDHWTVHNSACVP